MASRVPVTPPESAEWMGRMMAEIWAPFVGKLVLKENLGAWQVSAMGGWGADHPLDRHLELTGVCRAVVPALGHDHHARGIPRRGRRSFRPSASRRRCQEKVSSTAPPGWSIELADMSFGTDAPRMSNYRVSDGRLPIPVTTVYLMMPRIPTPSPPGSTKPLPPLHLVPPGVQRRLHRAHGGARVRHGASQRQHEGGCARDRAAGAVHGDRLKLQVSGKRGGLC